MRTEVNQVGSLFVLLDSSRPETEAQLPWAELFARRWGVPITLLQFVDPAHVAESVDFAVAAANDYLSLVAGGDRFGDIPVGTEVRVGLAHEEWRTIATAHPAAALMMLGVERGAAAPAFLSGMIEDVIRTFISPFVIIPQRPYTPADITRIVVGTDHSSYSDRVLLFAREIAPASGVQTVEVQVIDHGSRPEHEILGLSPHFAEDSVRLRGRPGPSLLAVARNRDAQMIVVGSHGRSGLARGVIGSTAEWLARHSDRPVVILPEPWLLAR